MPVRGTLDDAAVLAQAARDADVTINTANAGHRGAAEAMVKALAGSGKIFLHTSGSSIVGTRARGELVEQIFDEDTPFTPTQFRAPRVAIDEMVRGAAENGVRALVIAPSLIYGRGRGLNPHSIQVPWLIALARKFGVARHIGSGENRWANVHIDDLVTLYLAAIEKAPAGAFYFAENGENSMREAVRGDQPHAGLRRAQREHDGGGSRGRVGRRAGQRHHGLQQPRARQTRARRARLAPA